MKCKVRRTIHYVPKSELILDQENGKKMKTVSPTFETSTSFEHSDCDSQELTFIVLARGTSTNDETRDECKTSQMIGDVNLFFKGNPSDDDFEVEAEIMIAGACCS